VYVFWGTEDNYPVASGWDGSYYYGFRDVGQVPPHKATGLTPDTLYCYRFFATNSLGSFWATPAATFQTLPDWTAYGHKMKITLNGYDRAEPLTNFPALVVFHEGIPEFKYSHLFSTNGYDLRFRNHDETAVLNYEIERWNPAGSSYVWVQVDVLATNRNCIWAYYGNPAAAVAPAPYTTNGATWDSTFVGVWHMSQTNALDSTANRNNGTALGTVTNATGYIGTAQAFSGASPSGIQIPTSASFDGITNAVTLSAWAYLRASGNYPMIWTRGADRLELRFNAGTRRLEMRSPDTITAGAGDANALSNWCYVAGTFSDPLNTAYLYVNARPIMTNSAANSAMNHAGYPVYLGRRSDGYYLDGILDEIRAEKVVRSTNWIWACYMTMASNDVFAAYEVAPMTRGTLIMLR